MKNQSNFTFLHDFDIVLTKTFFTFIFFATAFETINSLKRSNSLFFTFENVFIRMKNESFQCSFIQSQNSIQDDLKIEIQKFSVIDLFFTSFTSETICEFVEKSIVTCSSFSQKSSISFTTSRNFVTNTNVFLQIVSFKNLHFLITTSEIAFENAKSTSNSITEIAKIAKIFAKSIANIRAQIVRIRVKRKIEYSNFKLQTLNSTSKSMKKISIQQIVCVRICKRCKQNFNFNNKFHEHIRQHHARKSIKSSDFRVFTQESTCKIKKKSAIECSFTLFATSRSQIFSTKIISQFLSSKCSNLSIATYKISSKSMKSAIVVCSFIFSFISSHNLVSKSQKFHIQKFYLIASDLNRMFVEKFKLFDLRQHHNRRFFQQNFDIRQYVFSSFIFATFTSIFESILLKRSHFLLRHSISHQNRRKNYQSIVHLHFRFHFLEHLYQNIRNFISLSIIWFACFVKNLNHLIYVNIKKNLLFRNVFHFVNYVFCCINHE